MSMEQENNLIPTAVGIFCARGGAEWGEDRVSGGEGRDFWRFLSGFGDGGVFVFGFSEFVATFALAK